MRLITGILVVAALILWTFLAFAVGGARRIGQQRDSGAFPVPSESGCWEGLCFYQMERAAAVQALEAHPAVRDAAYVPELQPGGYDLIEFHYQGRQDAPVMLYWSTHSYTLTRDWRLTTDPLLRLGDALAVLGPPERVSLSVDYVLLDYPTRRLSLMVLPAAIIAGSVRVSPGDAVISLQVVAPDIANSGDTIYYPPTFAWEGFGAYAFP